jgi:hypothetical protein
VPLTAFLQEVINEYIKEKDRVKQLAEDTNGLFYDDKR